jgi:hypothetical protein
MYKVIYLVSRIENNQTIYNKQERVFKHRQDANSFIETIGKMFIMIKYYPGTSIH